MLLDNRMGTGPALPEPVPASGMARTDDVVGRFLARVAACLVLLTLAGGVAVHAGERPPNIEVFVRAGCPHCQAAKEFLAGLQRERPALSIALHDIEADPAARARLFALAGERGITPVGVPAFLLGTELLIGFSSAETTGREIRERLERSPMPGGPEAEGVRTPWFGEVRVGTLGLPLFTLAIGLVDGFNPCSMWVLLFMLSLLAGLGDRTKMFLIGGTFVAIEGLAYFAFMAAWLNTFLLIGLSRLTEVILGGVGVLAGAVNIKDFWASKRGMSLGIPSAAKPGLYAGIRRILQADNMAAAIVATILFAVLVQAVELLCTAGLPALYTRILTMQSLDSWSYYGYLVLYNAAYMLDDVVVLAIGVVTISHYKLQEREGRWLKLLSGVVMAGLGAILLLHPQWLV